MKRKKAIIAIALVIIIAAISIPCALYISLVPYEWDGTYLVNTKTGIRYQSSPELNKTVALDKINPAENIGRIKEDSLFFKTWVKKIEGMDENKYIYLQGLMYFEVLEAVDNSKLPKDFNFILKYGVGAKNIADTYKGSFEKDLISAGTAKARLNFTPDEMKQIYERMQTIDILSYPSIYSPPYEDNPKPGLIRIVEPHMTYDLRLNINGNIKEISWVDKNGSETANAKELRKLYNYIIELIESKEEYKRMPEAVGGYE